MSRFQELLEEFKMVFSGKGGNLLDSFFPLLVFLIVNPLLGLRFALWGALLVAGGFSLYRVLKKESLVYALGGLGGVLLAALFVNLSGSEAGFFLPGLISGAVTVVLCAVSVVLNRPIAAWSSFITRRWPLGWYWHPKVLPAYNEVTIMWAVAFAARLALEFWFFQQEAIGALGASKLLLGWPYIVILLVISYLYGVWRLNRLNGPSTEEFKKGKEPPWDGQRRGF
jgi:hypothetical protein